MRDNETGGRRTVSPPIATFIGRFLRHYGLLACGHKRARLAAARAALQTLAPQAVVIEAAEDFLDHVSGEDPRCCPRCRVGRWHTVEIVIARRCDPPAPAPRCRDGPP
ncbi:putative transposase [Thauera sp. 28]|nr:putative transposase [Thauera sp. 28]